MPPGTAEALRNLLNAAPAVKLVHLNNDGGVVAEGCAVHKLIHERGLTTYTATNCGSACTVAFLGGGQRLLSSNARLGFHSSSYGELDNRHLPKINADLRRKLQRHRVPDWFIEKALTTSAKEMWYPTQEELLRAGVITKIVDPHQFGTSGMALDLNES